MGSGKFRIHNGKFLLSPSGKFAIHSDCCCDVAPICQTCSDAQPDATVTVNGVCGDALCEEADDTYSFLSYEASPTDGCDDCCRWTWEGDADDAKLIIQYGRTSSDWCATIIRSNELVLFGGTSEGCECGADYEYPYEWLKTVTDDVSCSGGNVTGTFTLDGQDFDVDCADCTASVTVG